MVKHGTRIFVVEISRMKFIQKFLCFSHHAMKNYATILSELDKLLAK